MSLHSFGNKLRSGPLGAVFFGIVIVCVGVLAFTGLGTNINRQPDSQPTEQAPSDIVAKIDGTSVTVSQFENAIDAMKQQYSSYGPAPSIIETNYIRAQAFNQLQDPIFAAELARERGLTVSDTELQGARNKVLTQLRTELSLPSNASEDDISSALAQHSASLETFVNDDEIRNQLLVQKYLADVNTRSAATDEMVRNYYEQVHTRHILISNKNKPDAQALALAQNLIARLDKGADFFALAKQYSDDPGTKDKGGDDGFIDQTTQYDPSFKTAALALKPWQITQQPVSSSEFGYFIIQAVAVKSNLPKDYAKNHQQYASQVSQSLAQQTENSDLAAEKAKATIVVIDPRLKADLAISNINPSDPNRLSTLQGALSEYETALKTADLEEKSEIYVSMAQVYEQINQPDNEISVLKLATANIIDSQLYLMLGDLYKKKGDITDALAQYESASDHAYDDPEIHRQLETDFKSLSQSSLYAKETAWMASYNARQKQQPLGTTSINTQL